MVPVKRDISDPASPPPHHDSTSMSGSSGSLSPISSPSKKAKTSKSTPVKQWRTSSAGSSPTKNGSLTPDKREELIETILAHGLKTISYPALAAKLGISVVQLRNATQAGKKGNLRYKAAKSVRGD